MSTTAKQPARSIVVLLLPKSAPALIALARTVVQRMTGNAGIPNPTPTLAVANQAITDCENAETAAQSRVKGAVATRNEKQVQLANVLHALKSSVQTAADANREAAPGLIQSCGMTVKKVNIHQKHVFAAKQGPVSGTVKLTAQSAARRASYDWQMSLDAGKTWTALPSTLQAHTAVTGVTPGSTVSFRVRPLTKTGEGDWSQPTSLLVH